MARKRWSPVVAITDSVLKLRQKKKWQIALRRYVVEMSPCYEYAPYFGLSIADMRLWFESQFTPEMNWDNFGLTWQFEHLVSTHWFDWNNPEELRLCWNFTNIRAAATDHEPPADPLGYAKQFYSLLFKASNYPVCSNMLSKLEALSALEPILTKQIRFLRDRSHYLPQLTSLDAQAYAQLNSGQSPADLLKEITLLKKYST